MHDHELYQRILGLAPPWVVTGVRLSLSDRRVYVVVGHTAEMPMKCPICGQDCSIYDHGTRLWRHLDTCQLRTMVEANVPRVSCPEHGVHVVQVPWAEPASRFTALFEAMVIAWLCEATTAAVAELVGLSWDQVDGIQQRAVDRGLARRPATIVKHMGIDETSYQENHDYVSVISDHERGVVLDVLDDRKKDTVADWLKDLEDQQRKGIETVAMDMWDAYIGAFREQVPDADTKICFDRFHVAAYFCKAVNQVRIAENKHLLAEDGKSLLAGTQHAWLVNSERTDNRSRVWFMELTRSTLKTARAWAIKEQAGKLWNFTSRTWAEKSWRRLIGWIDRSRLAPVRKVGAMVKTHLWGIINAIVHASTNALGESMNAKIQKIKARACGFRNRARFRRAILFHLGGLDLLPAGASPPTHTKA